MRKLRSLDWRQRRAELLAAAGRESSDRSSARSSRAEVAADFEPLSVSDIVAPLLFVVLVIPVATRTVRGIDGSLDLVLLLPALLIGVVGADLATGFLHWTCDTFFHDRTPIIGPALIAPFREHHHDPLAMTRKGFFRVSRASFFAMSLGLAVTWWRETGMRADCHSLVAHAAWLFFSFSMVLTNQLHMWAHAPSVPKAVALLQRHGLIVSPSRHARHHTPPFRRAYCITTGWSNRLLDRLDLFARLEQGVRRSTRMIPRRKLGWVSPDSAMPSSSTSVSGQARNGRPPVLGSG